MSRLQQSFGAVYRLLERPRAARRAVAASLVIHTCLLAYSAYVHSPTLNEPAHLVAGLSHWKFGRFELYRVNPPLVHMVAALPVIAAGYNEDWSGFYEGPGARPEMGMGEKFVAANGERSFFLFMIARCACIPFSWIGAIVCFLWARDLYGRPSGVMAAGIWCFEPNILAHASLITADVAATALGLAACYTLWRWLKKPSWTQTALTGAVLGLAELAKTTLILFYPLWPFMWLVYRWPQRHAMVSRDWLREAGMLTMRMAIGLYVLNSGYGFEGSFTKLKNFQFVSDLFIGSDNPKSEIRNPKSANRFANSWLGELPVPFPKNYLLGIDIQQSDFENYGRPSYLCGKWSDRGWWYFYLCASAIKVPLGLWILGFLQIGNWSCPVCGPCFARGPTANPRNARPELDISLRDELILLVPPVVLFLLVSSKSGFSEHLRYVLPAFPFCFIAIAQLASVFCPIVENSYGKHLTTAPPCLYKVRGQLSEQPQRRVSTLFTLFMPIGVVSCGCWLIVSSLFIYPHSLSYFNETVGGPLRGSNYLIGSNVDWGQDLRYLNWHFETYDRVNSQLKFACHGTPEYLCARQWPETRQDPTFDQSKTDYWIVSVDYLQGLRSSQYDLLDSLKSSYRLAGTIGYSMRYYQRRALTSVTGHEN